MRCNNPKNRGHEKLIELLKIAPELLSLKEWKDYVQEKKNKMDLEEKKDTRVDRKWQGKARKMPSPEKPAQPPRPKLADLIPSIVPPPPPPMPQALPQQYQIPYGVSQPQAYPQYYMPNAGPSQAYGYQYYYGSYPRPPY